MDCASSVHTCFFSIITGAHPNASSSHKHVSCIILLAPVDKTQSRLTKSRCPNISHFLAPLGIPCSTVHHFDCSFSLPPCPDIFPYNIHRPSFLPSTRPKLKLHLLVIQHHSCPSSLVLRCITLSSRIQVPRLLSTPHLVLSRRSCSCNIVYLEPVEAYYLHMQKERYSRLHSQIPLPSHYWPILQVYS